MASGCEVQQLPRVCSDSSCDTTVALDATAQCTPRNASTSGPFHNPTTPSFMTQAVPAKKQPRSPRDQVSPKRARTGAEQEATPGEEVAGETLERRPDEVPPQAVHPQAEEERAVFAPVFHALALQHPHGGEAHAPATGAAAAEHRWGDAQSPRYHPGHQPHTAQGEPAGHSAVQQEEGEPAPVLQLALPPHVLAAQVRQQAQQQQQPQQAATVVQALPPPPSSLQEEVQVMGLPQQEEESEEEAMAVATVESSLAMVHVQQQQQEQQQQADQLDYMDFDPLLFIKLLPPLEHVVPKHRTPLLPHKTRHCKPKTLVLDLDETLVHSCLEAHALADFTFPVHFNNQEHVIHVRQRPHLHAFMERVAELYEVVVFTASQKIYAEKLLNIIDPEGRLIKHRIFRESCVVVDGNYLKDLSVLGRDLRTTLIVDNSPQAFGFQVDNGVPVESWYDDPADVELLKLLPFLEALVHTEDVRPAIRSKFRMRELIDRVVC